MKKENKIILIVDKSASYINFYKERTLEEWNIENSQLQKSARIKDISGSTLFGDSLTSIVNLENTDSVKMAIIDLESSNSSKFSNGLIITSNVPRTSTKKLESLVMELGGTVYTSNAKDKTPVSQKLVNELNLNRLAKDFLLSYVGDDYEIILPLIKTLSTLSQEKQYMVSESDIYLRMPKPPGALPPWSLENPLLSGNIEELITSARRVALLPALSVLSNKFKTAYKISVLFDNNPRITLGEISTILSVPNNYSLKLSSQTAKKYGSARLCKVVQILTKCDSRVKGAWNIDSDIVFEISLIEAADVLR